jgi:hypothetical protein
MEASRTSLVIVKDTLIIREDGVVGYIRNLRGRGVGIGVCV